MKSSMATTSVVGGLSFGPSAELPLVMRTLPTRSPALNTTPRNDSPLFDVGAKNVPSELPLISKNWMLVVLARSTSVKTTPKPLVNAITLLPGTKKLTATTLLPRAVNRRCGLKVVKMSGYVGLMFPNSIGVDVGFDALALTWNPVPGVENTTPRGEFTLKKLAGKLLGAEKASGTPSQLISRRPLPKLPTTLGFSVPRVVRKESTVDWMAAALAPDALKVMRSEERR